MRLENFKAWREANLTFGSLTGFFGANSAGKSSLLDLLLLLKQTRNATDRGIVLEFGSPSEMVDLGSLADVIHEHDVNKMVRWSLEWILPDSLVVRDPMRPRGGAKWESEKLAISCEVALRNNRPFVSGLTYRFAETDFRVHEKNGSRNSFELSTSAPDFNFVRNQGRPWPLRRPIKTHLFPDEAKTLFQNSSFLSEFELRYERWMDSIHYLGPLREHPKREYNWAGSRPADVGQRGERTIDAILAATARGEKRNLGYKKRKKTFQEMISYWLRELGLIHSFALEEIAPGTRLYRAKVRASPSSAPTALTDVGFGVSQVLPVLVLLYYVPERSTVLLEQPEIHLHPAVQSGLADVMLTVAKTRKVQIIVESHSEHLLRRIQRRIAEERAKSEDVQMYFVSKNGGEARLADLSINLWGEIENWPSSFFGDELGEIAAITEASLKRKLDSGS